MTQKRLRGKKRQKKNRLVRALNRSGVRGADIILNNIAKETQRHAPKSYGVRFQAWLSAEHGLNHLLGRGSGE